MPIRTKRKRKITAGKDTFYWIYKFRQDILRLTVKTEGKTHSRLVRDFNHKNLRLYFRELVKDDSFYDVKLLIITEGVLTRRVARQELDHGLKNGWEPFEMGKDFLVKDVENYLDINFWTKTTSEIRKSEIQNPKSKIYA